MIHRILPLKAAATCVALFLACQAAQAGDYEKGLQAYKGGKYQEAVSLLKPLAQEGHPYAQFAVGVMYDDGRGLPQNYGHALIWYTRAAKAGLVDAQYMVGRFFGRGRGVKQNPARAFFWFNLAGAGGHPYAPRLRDQQRSQVSRSQRDRIEDEAVSWLSTHPAQFSCKGKRCIFPSWTARPTWTIFDPLPAAPP
jgi:TPR repeat protein